MHCALPRPSTRCRGRYRHRRTATGSCALAASCVPTSGSPREPDGPISCTAGPPALARRHRTTPIDPRGNAVPLPACGANMAPAGGEPVSTTHPMRLPPRCDPGMGHATHAALLSRDPTPGVRQGVSRHGMTPPSGSALFPVRGEKTRPWAVPSRCFNGQATGVIPAVQPHGANHGCMSSACPGPAHRALRLAPCDPAMPGARPARPPQPATLAGTQPRSVSTRLSPAALQKATTDWSCPPAG